jgi:hypothetical protein
VASGAQREKEEPSLEEGSGSPSNCETAPGPKYAGASIVLFCFILRVFCFVLFCFVLFCFVLFCFVLFCFMFQFVLRA